jgi:hypothetical protein
MSSGTPTVEINVTDAKGIDHIDWLQDLVNTNHLVLRNRAQPSDSLIIELSSNTPGAGFQTLVGAITSGSGTFLVGATYDIWAVTTSEDLVVGPASSTPTIVPAFSDTTGTLIQQTNVQYDTGEVILSSLSAAVEIQERAAAPTFAADKGHVWVKDDAPNTLTFTDDLGTDFPIVPPNTVVLGEWAFGGAALGVTAIGEFETDQAIIGLIQIIRFNALPDSGQNIGSWADLLPQEGILYFQDITDPGGTNLTFPYTSLTFPLGGGWPQFNGLFHFLSGTTLGPNWSTNNYSVQIVATAPSLDRVVNAFGADNDVIVPSANPIIIRDNAVNQTALSVTAENTAVAESTLEIQRDAPTDVALQILTESFIPDDYVARWDSTTSDGMTFTTSEAVGDIATWLDETATFTFDDVLTNDPIWDPGQVAFDGSSGLQEIVTYGSEDATWIICGSWDGVSGFDYMFSTPNEVFVGNNGGANEKISFVLNAAGSPLYYSATDLTDETVVATVTNKHNGTNDNDKEVWLGTTYIGGEFGQTDALSDNNLLTVGHAVSGSQATIGFMYEIIVYDRTLSAEEIANVTNELSIKWSAQSGDGLSSVVTSSTATTLSLSASKIVPGAKTLDAPFSIKGASTSSGTEHGVDLVVVGGDHTGSLRGGNLALDAGASTSGANGIVRVGASGTTDEIIFGHSVLPGVTITEGTDHPVAPAAGRAQVWVKNDYVVPATATTGEVNDGQGLVMTTDTGLDINLSWLAANYKSRIGGILALLHIEDSNIPYAGGTAMTIDVDSCVSYIYDWLSNMWYQAFIDNTSADALVTSSSDGGYTWVTSKVVDTSIAHGDLAQPCTNGTNLGVGADGAFYLSTTLSATNLPGSATGSPSLMSGSTGLVWSEQASLWVMCGDNATDGFVYTSPNGITWTNRSPAAFASSVRPVAMDIAHTGFGGYEGTERILMVCGTTSNNVFFSTDGGVTWGQDVSWNPTGAECIVWAPSIGNGNVDGEPGAWMAIDAGGNLFVSDDHTGTNFYDTLQQANSIYRTEEWAGYLNTSTNATWYTITTNSDSTTDGIGNQTMGVTWQGMRPMFVSRTANIRARYQWGNGVIMWNRAGDAELVFGRYGPIKP